MTQPTIDTATFEDLRTTAGADFVRELVDTFLADAPGMLEGLRRAFEDGDAEGFRRVAHTLKSNGNTFGATTLAALARNLELGGLEPVRAASGASLDTLDAEYARVAKDLAERARG
jgi:HPt (histidine-containing phosphotransfer) domain-containing protein